MKTFWDKEKLRATVAGGSAMQETLFQEKEHGIDQQLGFHKERKSVTEGIKVRQDLCLSYS